MKLGIFVPCYRETLHWVAHQSILESLIWGDRAGHEMSHWYTSSVNVAMVRNQAMQAAIDRGLDYLLMQDADCGTPPGVTLLERLYVTAQETGAAAAGAVFVCRNGDKVNVEPGKPGEVYDAEVGTGVMLLDVAQVSSVGPPWFMDALDHTGQRRVCGEDITLCRLLKGQGMRVVADWTFPTLHVAEAPISTEPSLRR